MEARRESSNPKSKLKVPVVGDGPTNVCITDYIV